MCVDACTSRRPDWDRLFETARAQEGLFATKQAAAAGYSPQLLAKYLKNGKVVRVRRGVYRIVHYPAGDHEDLVALWLWSGREGVFSYETALALHDLSDVLPAGAHLTLPASWRRRRLRVPRRVKPHYADLGASERVWIGAIPVTSVLRTLRDCAAASISLETLRQAIADARTRGLVRPADLVKLERTIGDAEARA